METDSKWVILMQRQNDQYIMQLVVDGNFDLVAFKQCWLWLQVATMADITHANG